MWPLVEYGNPALPGFMRMRRTAANVPAPGEKGGYTLDQFAADFPEFYTSELSQETGEPVLAPMLPENILEQYLESANASVLPSRWGSDWRMAVGLFMAHLCALRLQTYADGSTPAQTAAQAANSGVVKTATLGDASVGYDNAAVNNGTDKWGTWNLTRYGSQLATMARMLGLAGMYAI